MVLRPLEPGDVPAAAEVPLAALPAPPVAPGAHRAWVERRLRHLQGTDPEGAWVAEADGAIVGVALALVRDGIWGLSLLAVHPDRQARGTGSALLGAAVRTAEGTRGALIASSADPKAMRAYARAGFALHPCVAAGGIVERSRLPGGLRAAPADDLERALAVSRAVRGGAYDPEDLRTLGLEGGVLALGDRGFAVWNAGSVRMLCAADDEAAADLLWSCLAAMAPGVTASVDLVTAGQDWAIGVVLEAGLALSPEGPMFTRGELGPLRPWLPSGALL